MKSDELALPPVVAAIPSVLDVNRVPKAEVRGTAPASQLGGPSEWVCVKSYRTLPHPQESNDAWHLQYVTKKSFVRRPMGGLVYTNKSLLTKLSQL